MDYLTGRLGWVMRYRIKRITNCMGPGVEQAGDYATGSISGILGEPHDLFILFSPLRDGVRNLWLWGRL